MGWDETGRNETGWYGTRLERIGFACIGKFRLE